MEHGIVPLVPHDGFIYLHSVTGNVQHRQSAAFDERGGGRGWRLRHDEMAGPLQHIFQLGFEQIGDVRNGGQHESLIAAVNLLQPDVRIVDSHMAAFADEMLQ